MAKRKKPIKIRKTRFQQLHLILAIIGALLTTGICVYTQTGLYTMAVWVSAVIVIFYLLGQAVRTYLQQVLKTNEPLAEEILEGQEFTADDTDNGYDDEFSSSFAEFDEANR